MQAIYSAVLCRDEQARRPLGAARLRRRANMAAGGFEAAVYVTAVGGAASLGGGRRTGHAEFVIDA